MEFDPQGRVVTGSADMMGAQVSHVAQVWRLSDLKLLKTLVLPAPPAYYVDPATDASEPTLEHVYVLHDPARRGVQPSDRPGRRSRQSSLESAQRGRPLVRLMLWLTFLFMATAAVGMVGTSID